MIVEIQNYLEASDKYRNTWESVTIINKSLKTKIGTRK